MKNTFNSTHELWTEIALSAGWVEVLAGSDNLSGLEQDRLNHIKAFGVANSYWRPRMINYVCMKMRDVLTRYPGTTD